MSALGNPKLSVESLAVVASDLGEMVDMTNDVAIEIDVDGMSPAARHDVDRLAVLTRATVLMAQELERRIERIVREWPSESGKI